MPSSAFFAMLCVVTHFFGGTNGLAAQSGPTPKHGTVEPVWHLDIRPAIQGRPLGTIAASTRETEFAPIVSLWFLDDKTAVASFVLREVEKNLRLKGNREPEQNSAFRLHAIFFDVASGQITTTRDWPTESRRASILAVLDGRFVTQRGPNLTLYSSDLTELKELSLPSTTAVDWGAYPSISGRTILFVPAGITKGSVPWILVDTLRLEILRTWSDVHSGWLSITDDKVAMVACGWKYDCAPKLDVKGFDSDWKTIGLLDRRSHTRPQFVSNQMLFLSGNPRSLIRTDGSIVFVEETPSEGGRAIPSIGGQRFVVPVGDIKGSMPELDISGRWTLRKILVYETSTVGRTYVLDVKGNRIKSPSQFALSPDALSLIVLSNGYAELLRLPPLQ